MGGKPIIEHVLTRLRQHGFSDILLCVNQRFKENFKPLTKPPWSVEIHSSPEPMGTAGELYDAREDIGEDPFLIHYGDELTKADISALKRYHGRVQHKRKEYLGSLALVRGVPMEVGVVRVKGNLITRFEEKPRIRFYTWAGIAILNPKILDYCRPGIDLGAHVFPEVLRKGYRLYAYKSDALWLDVGQIHHLRLAQKMAREGKL